MTGEPAGGGHVVKRAEPDGVFGLWLQRTLQSLFASVAEEPVPAEWLRILDGASEADEDGATKQP